MDGESAQTLLLPVCIGLCSRVQLQHTALSTRKDPAASVI